MAGAVILAVVLVVVFPVVFIMSGAVAAAILSWSLTRTAEQDHEGSELIALNR